jgi:hypothetical protein
MKLMKQQFASAAWNWLESGGSTERTRPAIWSWNETGVSPAHVEQDSSHIYILSSCRVVSHISSAAGPLCSPPSLPSPPLTVPLLDLSQAVTVLARPGRAAHPDCPDPVWQRDFELQYIELEEVSDYSSLPFSSNNVHNLSLWLVIFFPFSTTTFANLSFPTHLIIFCSSVPLLIF